MPHRGPPPETIGVAALALHNVAVHRLLPAPAGAALSLVTAAGLTRFATRSGCSPADLGIRAEDARSGARTGLAAAAVRRARSRWRPGCRRPVSDLIQDANRGSRLAVVVTTLPTTGASGVFAWLRLRSDSVVAPILAHAAINTSAYLAGRRVRRVLRRQAGAAADGLR